MDKQETSIPAESIRMLCHDAGLKVTHQRMEVLREVYAAKDHPSVEDLHKRLRNRLPMISLDTVYRTLETFEECGLVRKVPVSKGPARYEAAEVAHHHCICARCRAIIDVPWPDADNLPLPPETQIWGSVKTRHVQLQGVCHGCAEKGPEHAEK